MARSDLSAADGVVDQVQKTLSILNHHPVPSIKGSFATFFLMSRPPLLARRGDRSPVDSSSMLLPPQLRRGVHVATSKRRAPYRRDRLPSCSSLSSCRTATPAESLRCAGFDSSPP